MKFKKALLPLATVPFVSVAALASNGGHKPMSIEIEMYNQTQSQWFSPVLCALDHERVSLFGFGQIASTGQANFAEDGFHGVSAGNFVQIKVQRTGQQLQQE